MHTIVRENRKFTDSSLLPKCENGAYRMKPRRLCRRLRLSKLTMAEPQEGQLTTVVEEDHMPAQEYHSSPHRRRRKGRVDTSFKENRKERKKRKEKKEISAKKTKSTKRRMWLRPSQSSSTHSAHVNLKVDGERQVFFGEVVSKNPLKAIPSPTKPTFRMRELHRH